MGGESEEPGAQPEASAPGVGRCVQDCIGPSPPRLNGRFFRADIGVKLLPYHVMQLTNPPDTINPELTSAPAVDPAQRAVWLDVMRGVAILLVACGHMAAVFSIPKDISTFGGPIWFGLIQLAVAGVDIFLVLSGF